MADPTDPPEGTPPPDAADNKLEGDIPATPIPPTPPTADDGDDPADIPPPLPKLGNRQERRVSSGVMLARSRRAERLQAAAHHRNSLI